MANEGQTPSPDRGGGGFFTLRRALLILATMAIAVVALSGVALAANILGTFGPDHLSGTDERDQIYGLGAVDEISGGGASDHCYGGNAGDTIGCGSGNDRIDGGFGEDGLFGDEGNDTISAADGQFDGVDCEEGTNDTAYVDALDVVENCENVFVARPIEPPPVP